MTVKEELHQIVESLPDEAVQEALEYLRWLAADSDTLSEGELASVSDGEDEIKRGEYVTLAELRQTLED